MWDLSPSIGHRIRPDRRRRHDLRVFWVRRVQQAGGSSAARQPIQSAMIAGGKRYLVPSQPANSPTPLFTKARRSVVRHLHVDSPELHDAP